MTDGAPSFDLQSTPIKRGVTLIEASAGTGKTYSLTGLVLRLILEGHVDGIGKILVMTFTNAATAELVERIRGALRAAIAAFGGDADCDDEFLRALAARHGGAGLRELLRAQRELDDLEVCTIHGFCRRTLDQHAFETGSAFDIDYASDDAMILAAAAQDYWRRTVYPAGPLMAELVEREAWTPGNFLEDYVVYRRHLRTELCPTPVPLTAAIRALEDAADRVRDHWRRREMTEFLAGAAYVKGRELTPAKQAALLEAADRFCTRDPSGTMQDVLALGPKGLGTKLKGESKKIHPELPFSVAVAALAAATEPIGHALRAAFFHELPALVDAAKRSAGTAHYDDLLHRLHAALADPVRGPMLERAASAQYQAVLVDEFQDTDALQYEIFHRLFAGGHLFFVGDPKQAIYAFRGADVFAYMRAKRDAGGTPYALDTNFRSEAPLIGAVNATFSRRLETFVLKDIPFTAVRPAERADQAVIAGDDRRALEWMWLPDESRKDIAAENAVRVVVGEIVRLLTPGEGLRIGDRPIAPQDIAVLVGKNKRATRIQSALREAGVPAVVSQAGSVLESDEAFELYAVLASVASPRNAGALRTALATRVFGYDAAALAALGADDKAWQAIVDVFDDLRKTWWEHGFVAMAEKMLLVADARVRLLASTSGPRRLTNLLHLVELTEKAVEEHHFTPDGVVTWLDRVRADPKLLPEDTAEIRLESDAAAVQITTVFKSKGLEYGVVFCPFLWDVVEPLSGKPVVAHTAAETVVFQYPPVPDDIAALAENERLANEVRLAYVALTRAKHRCYVVWGDLGSTSAQRSALAHLLHTGPPSAKWREDLADFCAANAGVMAVRDYDPRAPAPRWQAPGAQQRELRERVFPPAARPRLDSWRVASFSSLRASVTVAAGTTEAPDHVDPAAGPVVEPTAPRGIFAFAKGARAGTCLHEIFEKCDFTRTRDDATAALVADTLRRHGLGDPSAHAAGIDPQRTVVEMLGDVFASQIPGANLSLSSVTRDRTLAEWQFHLSMGAVSRHTIAAVLARHGEGAVGQRYPSLLRALEDREVEGFLMGFVDLVFTHDDRWYVVDWKSNHLGNDVAAYDDDALVTAMCEHHYVLQYHLYVLALHRYLGQRLRGYDYERHMGGACYGFLRGIRAGSPRGWYVDRPPRALIAALDEVMHGAAAA